MAQKCAISLISALKLRQLLSRNHRVSLVQMDLSSPLFESSAAWFYYYESDAPPPIRNDKPLSPIQEALERGAKTLKEVNNSVLELSLVHMLKLNLFEREMFI